EPLEKQLVIDAGGHARQQRPGKLREPRPPVDAAEVGARHELAHQKFGDWLRSRDARLEGFRPFLADQRVRVMPFGEEQESELPAVARMLERVLERAPGRIAAGS